MKNINIVDIFGLFLGFCVTVCIFIYIGIGLYSLSQPKTFDGYYLYHDGMDYTIYINWDNRSDEKAFETKDPGQVLVVYKNLVEFSDSLKVIEKK